VSDLLETHRHSITGFELPVPVGWERSEEVEACALVAVEPPRGDPHLRANVVVTLEVVPEDEDLEAWTLRSLASLRESLQEAQVLDVETLEIGGVPARRALTHYLHADHGGAALEQWLLLHRGLGMVISCTTAALEYDDLFDLTHAIAEGLRLP
jgi:hypothetical protein